MDDYFGVTRMFKSIKLPSLTIQKKTLFLVFLAIGLFLVSLIFELPLDKIKNQLQLVRSSFGWEMVIFGAIVYAILLSIPFFPGVELGWLIILLYGRESVIVIYLFTVLGLLLSFSFGRWIGLICNSCKIKIDRFSDLYSNSFNKLSVKIHRVYSKDKCNVCFNRTLRKSQYLILAILFNIPGNSIIGGGGGIALFSGMNKTITPKGFLLTLILAVAPLPILLYFGVIQIDNLLM